MAEHVDAAERQLNDDLSPSLEENHAEDQDLGDGDTDRQAKQTPEGLQRLRSDTRLGIAIGVAAIVILASLGSWLGYRSHQDRQSDLQRRLFVAAGRQAALNLTTISYTEVDADLARILDSAVGRFRDDFQQRSQPFIEVVKKAQSKSEGTVTEAGLESQSGDQAQVLVAVSVKTSNAGALQQDPRLWRMRISVQQAGNSAEVSDVQFVS